MPDRNLFPEKAHSQLWAFIAIRRADQDASDKLDPDNRFLEQLSAGRVRFGELQLGQQGSLPELHRLQAAVDLRCICCALGLPV